MGSKYCQLTESQRYQVCVLRDTGISVTDIAEAVCVHKSTVYRELERNSVDGVYDPCQAHKATIERRCIASSQPRITSEDWDKVDEKLVEGWSPEQISNRFKKDGVLKVSTEWVYQHVLADKESGGKLYKNLRHSKRYKKRVDKRRRMKIPERVGISRRPNIVDKRERLGDWEADTIIGVDNQGAALTLVDRVSKYLIFKATRTKKADPTADAAIKALKSHKTLTVTFDNGPEFAKHTKIRDELNCETYFCDPFTSQQRGTSENTNGLIRQYLPKNRELKTITQQECDQIANKLNNRPRKTLNWATPNEYVALHT